MPRRPPHRLVTAVHYRYRWCAYSRIAGTPRPRAREQIGAPHAGTAPDGSLETSALLTLACLAAAYGGVLTVSEHSPARDDEWRQRQAALDAQAIMQGMAQARQRAERLARTGR
jgi:hypothetical protein